MNRLSIILALALSLALNSIASAQERGWATAITWSPDGETIAVGSTTGVWFFDTDFNETGFVATPELKGFPPDSMDWNATSEMIAISFRNDDTPVLVISAVEQRVITRIDAYIPISVRWRPEGDVLATVSFFEVRIWDALTGDELIHIVGLEVDNPDVRYFNHLFSVCWLSDDVITVAGDYDIFIVRVSDQETLKTFGNLGTVAIDCHQDDKLVTTRGRVFDFDGGQRLVKDTHLATLDDYTFEFVSVAWSPDGSMIVANGNGGMCRFGVFDAETTEILAELPGSFSRVHDYLRYAHSIAWHPDGSRFAVLGQFDIRLWDAETFELLKRFDGFEVPFFPVSWDETGTKRNDWSICTDITPSAQTHDDSRAYCLGEALMKQLTTLVTAVWLLIACNTSLAFDRGVATAIAWSPDGETVAVASTTGLWLFDTDFNEIGYVPTPALDAYPPSTMDWHSSGKWIALSNHNYEERYDHDRSRETGFTILVIDVAERTVVSTVQFPRLSSEIRWHPVDTLILGGEYDGRVKIMDAFSGDIQFNYSKSRGSRNKYNRPIALCWISDSLVSIVTRYVVYVVEYVTGVTKHTISTDKIGNGLGFEAADCHQSGKIITDLGYFIDGVDATKERVFSLSSTLHL